MKRILLIGLSACALMTSAHANEPKSITVIQSTHAEEDARAAAQALANMPESFVSLYHLIANTPHPSKVMEMYAVHLKLQREKLERAHEPLAEGDTLPLPNTYDDAATIKMYLRDSGYTDLSDAQITNVIAYMKANGIHHISELSELTKALEASSQVRK